MEEVDGATGLVAAFFRSRVYCGEVEERGALLLSWSTKEELDGT